MVAHNAPPDEVPKNKWVDENLFSDTWNLFFGIKFPVKRHEGRSPEWPVAEGEFPCGAGQGSSGAKGRNSVKGRDLPKAKKPLYSAAGGLRSFSFGIAEGGDF